MRAAIVLNSKGNIAHIDEDYIIATDAGYEYVQVQGRTPNIVIGDFDSSKIPEDLDVLKLQVEKDDTDGQAAIEYAFKQGFKEITLYGVCGGRLDHELCNLSLLAKAHSLGIKIKAKQPNLEIFYAEAGEVSFDINKGATFSIIAFGDKLTITDGKGCKYPIGNLTITKYDLGRSISNIALDTKVSFKVLEGSCFIFKY